MPLVSGKSYVFYNKQAGTALDLDVNSGNVQGWSYHGGRNQQWKVIRDFNQGGSFWNIQNVQQGTFLAIQNNPPHDGTRIICTSGPISWSIAEGSQDLYKISVFFAPKQCVDLADGGGDGTPVQCWTSWDGDNQKWEAQEA